MSGMKGQRKVARKTSTRSNGPRTRSNRKFPKTMVGFASAAINPMKPFSIGNRSSMKGRTVKQTGGSKISSAACHIRGTDFLSAVTSTNGGNAAGDVLTTQIANPRVLGLARLATMANLFERFKFRRLSFRYVPVANATQTGQLLGYVDYDVIDNPTGLSGVQNLQRAAAHLGEKPVQIWEPVTWEVRDVDPLTDLYTSYDEIEPRWSAQGIFVLLAGSAIASNIPLGNIYIDYDVDFFIPQVEEGAVNGFASSWTAGGSPSTSSILGTSVASSWNNLNASISGNVVTVPAGSFLVTLAVSGTGISSVSATAGSGVSVVSFFNTWNSAGTAGQFVLAITSTTGGTFTLSATASTVTTTLTRLYVSQMPSNALTLTRRDRLRMDSIRKYLKEDVPSSVSMTSFSTSSASCSSAPCLGSRVDDQYVLVKRS